MRLHDSIPFPSGASQPLYTPPLHFRRQPPQLNYPPDTVPLPDNGSRLELKAIKRGISLATPPRLTAGLQSLPRILNIITPNSIPGYSKASRGLFVLLWDTSIFTRLAISPSTSLRQSSSRYAIRAGRNSPDKEFRYLRTVIVTAGVHQSFGSELAPLPLTF